MAASSTVESLPAVVPSVVCFFIGTLSKVLTNRWFVLPCRPSRSKHQQDQRTGQLTSLKPRALASQTRKAQARFNLVGFDCGLTTPVRGWDGPPWSEPNSTFTLDS